MILTDLSMPNVIRRRRTGFMLTTMPLVAIILLIAVVTALVGYTTYSTKMQAREQLLRDALWVENAFQFQLASDEDNVARLALEITDPSGGLETFLTRGQFFLAGNPEINAIAWLDEKGKLRASLPALLPDTKAFSRVDNHRLQNSVKPVFGPWQVTASGELEFELAAPVRAAAGGRVIAKISLSTFLSRQVPWWIAERYEVRFLDANGKVLAGKAKVSSHNGASHKINFSPPFANLYLQLSRYRSSAVPVLPILLAALVALAMFMIISIFLLRRHGKLNKIIEDKLSSEIAFRRAMESSLTIGMRARNLSGIITYVNPAFCKMLGFEAAALIGVQPPMPYWLPDQIEETYARHNSRIHGERKPYSFEAQMRHKDGRIFDVLVYEAPLLDESGVNHGWMGSIIDITERKASTETMRRQTDALQHTNRLVTLGEMASTLAHELNQPLASITSYAQGSINLLRKDNSDRLSVISAIEKLSAQSVRAGRIIQRIRDFVRKQEPHFDQLDIEDLIVSTVAFMAPEAQSANVQIELAIEPNLESPCADKILMQQVLLNLIKNGVEAMQDSATKVLSIRAYQEGGQVCIIIADRGRGIDPEVEGQLFDAFVSTKPEGMGMGLNICRTIVEQHHGRLLYAPRLNGGAVFTINLPFNLGNEIALQKEAIDVAAE